MFALLSADTATTAAASAGPDGSAAAAIVIALATAAACVAAGTASPQVGPQVLEFLALGHAAVVDQAFQPVQQHQQLRLNSPFFDQTFLVGVRAE